MIKPITLGNKTFAVNLIQGPLAGVSCAPFRRLTWMMSQPAFSCSEMLSCKTILHQPAHALQRFIQKAADEGPVCFQLSSSDPAELAKATQKITDEGADLIDLNCGCPVKKIRRRGAGSSLLANPTKLYHLIRAMKDNTHLPVSIKIRVDGDSSDQLNQEIAKVVSEAGADYLIVHGRHWTQHYETPCDYAQIKFFVDTLSIPVIGNGDITCVDSLKKMFSTGCSGVMISRAGVGRPWLIKQLIAEMHGESFQLPSAQAMGEMLLSHVSQLAILLGSEKFALLQARKFAKYYARLLDNKMDFSVAVNGCESLHAFTMCVTKFFGN